jgi:hypothetical protein
MKYNKIRMVVNIKVVFRIRGTQMIEKYYTVK